MIIPIKFAANQVLCIANHIDCGPPASNIRIDALSLVDKRWARIQPAVPPPTIMKSKYDPFTGIGTFTK
ncbi:hypothetical protein DERF_008142 [Dermatophagoides farinae]|uniref:Uncharacterized protein n=1 Tax=Dermatophagoides farinae TaxID=6954 RepID=A0A922L406_DERFA|nr:hypothetical protein DERF_008142 [Dermatophagoides farinae]